MTAPVQERRLLRIRGRARANSERPVPAYVQAYLRGESQATAAQALGEGQEERRRFGRVEMNSEVGVKRIGGFNFQVVLKDVSNGGCRVEMVEPYEVSDSVITRFPQLEPLGSKVCWRSGMTTGLEFLTTIHPAVLDSLIARLPQLESEAA